VRADSRQLLSATRRSARASHDCPVRCRGDRHPRERPAYLAGVADLGDAIHRSIHAWPGPSVESVVFGTEDIGAIVAAIEGLCVGALAGGIEECLFYRAMVGCVVGVRLTTGIRRVIKAYQPRWSPTFLEGVCRIQRHLAEDGFPCPTPVAGPVPLGGGWATVEEYLPDPGQAALEEAMLTVSASGLADQIGRCRDQDGGSLAGHPLRAVAGRLYPEPHSPLFDFEATAQGASWIDELAEAGKELRDAHQGQPVIAHTDWSARNVRLGRDRVLAVYDWDSLALVPETSAVGQAAATWSAFGEVVEPIAPSAQQIAEFVRHYETSRGRTFTIEQRRAVGGAALWVLAYTARCEHAIDDGSGGHRRARPRLEADGRLLLDLPSLL